MRLIQCKRRDSVSRLTPLFRPSTCRRKTDIFSPPACHCEGVFCPPAPAPGRGSNLQHSAGIASSGPRKSIGAGEYPPRYPAVLWREMTLEGYCAFHIPHRREILSVRGRFIQYSSQRDIQFLLQILIRFWLFRG